jgi:hypothetical protein
MFHDLRYALRTLAKAPGFTAVVILTLALGIGACTAIFSVVDSVLLRPMPFPESDRLVSIWETDLPDYPEFSVSPGNFCSWQEQAKNFESIASSQESSYTLTGTGEPARLTALRVSANYLPTLRLQPLLGRNFRPEEDAPGAGTVALLGYGFWQRKFGGRSDALGQTLQLDGRPFVVVGVMPKSFRDIDVIAPFAFTAHQRQ